ncbi:MAG: CHAT domain-containing protein [Chitinophagaceae bacterium]|nr:CHAT domain-containing protein [Chitinophagaceae bacterium]
MRICRIIFLCLLAVTALPSLHAQTHADFEKEMVEFFNQGKFAEAVPVALKAKDAAKREFGDTSGKYILGLTNLAFLYEKTENYAATIPLYKEVAAIRKKTVGSAHPSYAVTLNDIGNSYFALKEYSLAEPFYAEALVIQKKNYGPEHPEYTIILKNIAYLYRLLNELNKATTCFEEYLGVVKKLKGTNSDEYEEGLNALSLVLVENGKYAAAIPLYKELAKFYGDKLGEEHEKYSDFINGLGRLYMEMADFSNSELMFRKAMGIRKKNAGENSESYAQSLNNMGVLFRKKGDFKTARTYYEQAVALRKRVVGELHQDYANSLSNLAELCEQEGDYGTAEKYYLQTNAIIKKVWGEESPDYAMNLNNLASLYEHMGKNKESEQLYRQAMAIRKKILGEEHPDYAQSLNNLAMVFGNTGQYGEAEIYYKQALAIRKKVFGEAHPDYAQTLSNLGTLYSKMGKYSEAEALFKEALAIRKKNTGEENPDYALVLDNLASLYNEINDFRAAEPLYNTVIAIRKKVLGENHPDYASSINNLAALYHKESKYGEAEKMYNQVIEVYNKTTGEETTGYATTLNNLGELYRSMGNYKTSESFFLRALAIKKKLLGPSHPGTAITYASLSALYAAMGKYALAEEFIENSNNVDIQFLQNNFSNLSESEKMLWWQDEAFGFEMAPSLLYNNPSASASFIKKTFTRQVQLKGFILKDGTKILEQVRQQGSAKLKELLNEWQTNKTTLARQYSLAPAKRITALDSLEKQTNELEKQLNQQSSLFRSNQQSTQVGFEEIQKALKKEEAAIEFIRFTYFNKSWTDSVFYAAFVVVPGIAAPQFVVLCEEKKLASILDKKNNSSSVFVKQLYRGLIVAESAQVNSKSGDSLFNLVWKPLLPFLKGVKKIHMAPAGLLNRVAFNALPVDSNTYLIDKYQLRQYSSVRQITEMQPPLQEPAVVEIVLFGGIDFDKTGAVKNEINPTNLPEAIQRNMSGGAWQGLPGTLEEVNKISQLFTANKKQVRVISGKNASEENFKGLTGRSPRILHLSTHGFSLPDAAKDKNNKASNQFSLSDNPLLRSGIIMAGANTVWSGGTALPGKEDGIVTAYEISNLDLSSTELVVLSACETALGDIRGTEGVFGLQRSFKLAGVQQMILSLWQVPDKETVELMSIFYANKLKGLATYDAFNAAQETMRKKYSPYFWAAFILVE